MISFPTSIDNGKNLIYFWDQIPIPQNGGAITLLLFSDLIKSMFSHFPLFNSYSIKFLHPKKKKKLKEFVIL